MTWWPVGNINPRWMAYWGHGELCVSFLCRLSSWPYTKQLIISSRYAGYVVAVSHRMFETRVPMLSPSLKVSKDGVISSDPDWFTCGHVSVIFTQKTPQSILKPPLPIYKRWKYTQWPNICNPYRFYLFHSMPPGFVNVLLYVDPHFRQFRLISEAAWQKTLLFRPCGWDYFGTNDTTMVSKRILSISAPGIPPAYTQSTKYLYLHLPKTMWSLFSASSPSLLEQYHDLNVSHILQIHDYER